MSHRRHYVILSILAKGPLNVPMVLIMLSKGPNGLWAPEIQLKLLVPKPAPSSGERWREKPFSSWVVFSIYTAYDASRTCLGLDSQCAVGSS